MAKTRRFLDPSVHTSRLLREYGPAKEAGWIVGGGAFLGLMAWAAFEDFRDRGGDGSFIAALVLGFFSLWIFRFFIRAVRRRVQVRERGLVVFNGVDRIEIPWENVESVHYGERRCYLQINRGRADAVSLGTEMKDLGELITLVRERTRAQISRRVQSALADGRSVTFGPIEILPSGVLHRSRVLLWEDLTSADLDGDFLWISECSGGRARDWVRIEVAQIPNADALIAVIQHRSTRARS